MRKKIMLMLALFSAANLYAEDEKGENIYNTQGFKLRPEICSVGISSSRSTEYEGKDSPCLTTGLSINLGYQHDERICYGVGVGYKMTVTDVYNFKCYESMPIYADLRLNTSGRKFARVCGIKLGCLVNLKGHKGEVFTTYQRKEDYKWFFKDYQYRNKQKGLYFCPELGFRIKKVDMCLSVPMMEFMRVCTTYDSQTHVTVKDERTIGMDVSVNLTLSYNIKL
ncbi:MAG: hypothetical protein K6F48_02735 [Paludibacteraceae bacterium]|nr:hypothetical protein [Paludibacteraceae bacterium]